MNVNGIGKQAQYEQTNGVKNERRKQGGGFYERLSENMNERNEIQQKQEESAATGKKAVHTEYAYHNVAASVEIQASESIRAIGNDLFACEAKGITYQESDYVKVFALQGFRLMAQVDADARNVYIEQKMDDGTVKGYLVDIDKLSADTKDPIEKTALEAWESYKAGEEAEDSVLTLEEALLDFYEFVEDRIKNGPPKYLIGNAEFSIEEWDKLLESIDEQLDDIREEMRERIEKLKEQMMQDGQDRENQYREDTEQDTEEKKMEEELLRSLFQDRKI